MEFQDAFRLAAVAQAGNLFSLHLVQKRGLEYLLLRCAFREDGRVVEGEILDGSGEFRRLFIGLLKAREEILEHSGGGSRCRYELGLSGYLRLGAVFHGGFGLFLAEYFDTVPRGGRSLDFHPGKPCFETCNLCFFGHHICSVLCVFFRNIFPCGSCSCSSGSRSLQGPF